MDVIIRSMRERDWPAVQAIYLEGIATGDATFETAAPHWREWDEHHIREGRHVAEIRQRVAGWSAMSAVSGRCIYSGVAEVSVYVSSAARGLGVGRALLQALIESSEPAGIWTLQAGIFPENAASIALHEACSFREVGRRERIGLLNGRWRNVLLMERRSSVVGIG